MKPLVVFVFFASWVAMFAAAFTSADFTNRDYCDARAIAEFVPKMSLDEHIEVINVMEETGGIPSEYAKKLRSLIRAAHIAYGNQQLGREPDALSNWVKRNCDGLSS